MHLEVIFIVLLTIVALTSLFGGGVVAGWPLILVVVMLATLVALCGLRRPDRWQVWPAYPAVALSIYAMIAGAGWAASTALVLLLLSAVLVAGFPLIKLPRPTGRFSVSAVETTRSHKVGDGTSRDLRLRIWYPAEGQRTEYVPIWSEFGADKSYPVLMRSAFAYLRCIRTYTSNETPINRSASAWPIILYNHSLVSFASETSTLLEALASQGYIVVSLEHRGQAAEHHHLSAQQETAKVAEDNELIARLRRRVDREGRAELSQLLFQNSTVTAEIVRRRVEDARFVLDNLTFLLNQIPGADDGVRTSRIFAMGYSVGGAVSTLLAQRDDRVAGVINLDGGLYGIDADTPLRKPYLMLYSEQGEGTNDHYLTEWVEPVRSHTIARTTHMSFHDIAFLAPALRWVGVIGRASPFAVKAQLLDNILDFLEAEKRG
jgi:dienelactone hydrolase